MLALLYVWMTALQSHCAAQLTACLAHRSPPRQTVRGWLGLFALHARVQPTALVVLPLAGIAALPLAWVVAFYQSFKVTGNVGDARRHAALWPGQNHLLLGVLCLAGLVVLLNALAAIVFVPWLLQTVLGVETAMSRSPLSQLNTTTVAAAAALTYLVLSPAVTAAYVLRCYDGESVTTGRDLLVAIEERAP
jgi:hypothetical protein